jgi:hypothetical protein
MKRPIRLQLIKANKNQPAKKKIAVIAKNTTRNQQALVKFGMNKVKAVDMGYLNLLRL